MPSEHAVDVPGGDPPALLFRDLGFTASPSRFASLGSRGPAAPPKRIIHAVSGLVRAGELLFVMGPSGSGKTSALDAIAGRVSAGRDGHVFLHGRHASPRHIKRDLKYVPQAPVMYETLTVEETLQYAAAFSTPDRSLCADRVDSAITALGLDTARRTRCGGAFYRGLSGGQLRRLAVATELVARPSVLLIDEVTSGLDATAAYAVMTHLRSLATSASIAIVCTIQQPPRRILDMADTLLLLAEGRVAYSGPTSDIVDYFARQGCHLPPRTTVSEWLMNETSSDFHQDPTHVTRLLDTWETSPENEALMRQLSEAESAATANGSKPDTSSPVYARSLIAQTGLLAKRNLTEALRNPSVIYLRLVMYLALAFVIGIGWFQLPDTAEFVQDRILGLGYTVAFFVFMAIAVLPVYLNEKQIVERERANASYNALAYVSGHFVMEIVAVYTTALLISVVVYFMVGFNPGASQFFFYFVALGTALLCAESIELLIAAAVPFLLGGIAISAFVNGMFMVVMGGLIDLSDIPWTVRWLQYIALHTYTMSALVWNDMDGVLFDAAPEAVPPIPTAIRGSDVANRIGYPLNSKSGSLAVIFGFIAVYRVLAFLVIHYRWSGKK